MLFRGFELLPPGFLRRISARLSEELDGFQRTARFRQGHQ
jgi:hypothetical protein